MCVCVCVNDKKYDVGDRLCRSVVANWWSMRSESLETAGLRKRSKQQLPTGGAWTTGGPSGPKCWQPLM